MTRSSLICSRIWRCINIFWFIDHTSHRIGVAWILFIWGRDILCWFSSRCLNITYCHNFYDSFALCCQRCCETLSLTKNNQDSCTFFWLRPCAAVDTTQMAGDRVDCIPARLCRTSWSVTWPLLSVMTGGDQRRRSLYVRPACDSLWRRCSRRYRRRPAGRQVHVHRRSVHDHPQHATPTATARWSDVTLIYGHDTISML